MRLNNRLLSTSLVLLFPSLVYADWIYFPIEYNQLYKEKYALELQLEDLRKQYQNDLKRLEEENRNLQAKNQNLQEDLELEKRNRNADKDAYADRIRDYEIRIRGLEKKGSDKEKSLLDDAKRREEKDAKEIASLRKKLEDDEKAHLQKEQELREQYEAKIKDLKDRIRNLENEISELKQMNKNQKRELERLSDQAKELEEKLSKEINNGEIRLKRFHNKLIINIDDKISFDSGSAELKPAILPAIDKIKDILAAYPENYISVEGHTDNVPIKSKYRNNWQLSTERALAVLEQLLTNKNLNPKNFSAAGYSEYQPIVPNTSKENKGLNRRVDIVVIPRAMSQSGSSE
ncbi:endoflagellar motor protein [Leptospira ryugenii]|uniref:Endoflagellar motor protein n=1 Tax=Leptospira ryugenii TaxID=1917863 RepID=A0A2P2DX79_9LEPT|nr:OmpA family protein [Leptospira ryugenii]GBF49222.1 endoflagellar motor protein [Leptospira ryugenii]